MMAVDKLRLEVVLDAVDRLTRPMKATRDESRQLAAAIKATQTKLKELGDTEERLGKLAAAGKLPFSNGTMAAMMRDSQQEAEKLNASLREQQTRLEALNRVQQRRGALNASTASIGRTRDSLARNGAGMAAAGGAMVAATGAPLAAFAQAEDAATGLKVAMMNARGEVPQAFADINKLATALGDKLPGTTADYQNMMTMLIRQGMSSQAILGGLGKATAYLGVQLKMPTEEAAAFASKMQDATRTSEKDMMGLMDVIQKGFYLGVDQNNMLQAFTKMSPALDILKKKGLEGAKALAPLVVMADQTGMAGEAAGNAYRKVFQMALDAKKIAKAGKEGGIGLDFTNGKGEFGGIEKMLGQLQKLKGLSTQKRLSVIKTIFGDDAETLQVVSLMIDKGVAGYNEVQGKMAAQADLQKRVNEQLGTLKNLWDAASGTFVNTLAAFGSALAPDIKQLVNFIGDLAGKTSAWSAAHPELSKWLMRIVGGAGLLLAVLGGLTMAAAAVLTPFTMISKGLSAFSTTAKIFTSGFTLISKGFSTFSRAAKIVTTGFTLIRTAVTTTTAFLAANPIVLAIGAIVLVIAGIAYLIYKYWEPIKAFFMGVWAYIDSAFKKYPILNYIFPIIGAARLLIQNWDTVKAFFAGIWAEIKTAFSGGIGGISTLITNWSPLGLFYSAFAKVMGYFGIELPGKFSEFGRMILQGLVTGITQGLGTVIQAVQNVAGAVLDKFKSILPASVVAKLGLSATTTQAGPQAAIAQAGAASANAVARVGRPATQTVTPIKAPGAGGSGAAAGGNTTIHVHPAPGMDEKAIASMVAKKVDEHARQKTVRARGRLADNN
jgi:TP901 family phage tail tape measure protein